MNYLAVPEVIDCIAFRKYKHLKFHTLKHSFQHTQKRFGEKQKTNSKVHGL